MVLIYNKYSTLLYYVDLYIRSFNISEGQGYFKQTQLDSEGERFVERNDLKVNKIHIYTHNKTKKNIIIQSMKNDKYYKFEFNLSSHNNFVFYRIINVK